MVQNTYRKDSYLSLKYLKGESLDLRTHLYVPKSKMSSIGKRKFEVESPSLWNGLRRVRRVKDFGKRLKTSFFFKY